MQMEKRTETVEFKNWQSDHTEVVWFWYGLNITRKQVQDKRWLKLCSLIITEAIKTPSGNNLVIDVVIQFWLMR